LSISIRWKVIQHFSFGWRFLFAGKILGFLGILNRLAKFGETAIAKSD
jgi:hypothetical protein